MSRPIDSEKVRQAWDLRLEGRQQREIAQALNMSLRHVQNYLSLDWLSRRSRKALVKGRADEANGQLEILRALRIPAGDGQFQGDESEQDGEPASTPCPDPHPWPDVAQMEAWGLPRDGCPGILAAWRRAHRQERHHLCSFWGELIDSVKGGIPFPEAYDLVATSWLASGWGSSLGRELTELYRLYRPWQDKVNLKVYLEEVQRAVEEHRAAQGAHGQGPLALEQLPRRLLYGLSRDEDDD